ncbi:MAG TPA: tetratricopeptide repeat protein [Verrucomicrobiae bacterium]
MTANTQRGLHLLEQNRYTDAEREFRQSISNDPDDSYTRALLALTLSEQERFDEAEREIAEALKIDPGLPFVHYVRASVLNDRRRYPEAERAVQEAINLNPNDADYYSLLAQVRLNQKNWTGALQASETGLQIDSEHVACTNLRAMALVNLGRKEEAGLTIESALAKDPENSVTHANQGWTLLHAGDYKKALEHFREALRLDPENEWARQGIVEALKAQNFLYAAMLKYFLWMSRLSPNMQWMVILGGFFGMRFLRAAGNSNPALKPFIFPIQIIYLIFVFLTWTAKPLFNLLLRLNKFGRMVLNDEEIVASNWIGGFVGAAVLCLIVGIAGVKGALLGALIFGFSVLPLSAVFECQPGWPRRIMSLYTIAVVGAGLVAFGSALADPPKESPLANVGAACMGLFLIGVFVSGFLGNFLMSRQPTR